MSEQPILYYLIEVGDQYGFAHNILEVSFGLGDIFLLSIIYIIYKVIDNFSNPTRVYRRCKCERCDE